MLDLPGTAEDRHIHANSLKPTKPGLLFFTVLILALVYSPSALPATVYASHGMLDLQDWKPAAEGIQVIDGDWLFSWQQLIDPAGQAPPTYARPVPLQQRWSQAQPNGHLFASGLGFGSYYLKILAPSIDEPLALRIPRYRRSYRAYVNGELLALSGDPEPGSRVDFPLHSEQLIPLPVKAGTIELVIHARNEVDYLGYAPQPALIGLQSDLQNQLLFDSLHTSAGIGIGLFIGLKYLLMFLFRRRHIAHLWLGVLGFGIGLHHVAWFIPHAPQLVAGLTDQTGVLRILLSTTLLFHMGFLGFLHSLYPVYFERRFLQAFTFCMLLAVTITLVYKPPVFTLMLTTLGPFSLIIAWLFIQRAYRTVRLEGTKAILIPLSVLLIIGAAVHDILWHNGLIRSNLPLLFNFSLLLLLLAFLLEEYDLDLYRKVKRLSGNLQTQVDERTEQLRERVIELHKKEAELTRAFKKAEQASLSKSRFLAAASHDLRQPLHAMGLLYDQLHDLLADQKSIQKLTQIEETHLELSNTLSALLDISRLDTPGFTPMPQHLLINDLFNALGNHYRVEALFQDMELRIRNSNGCVYADPVILKRIISNLLDNAIKYGSPPGVLLAARKRDQRWLIEVWDCGPGIAQDKQTEIFNEFYQLDNPHRDKSKGLGLGLSIVRRLCELSGFELSLSSQPGHGSRFRISVPAGNSESVNPALATDHLLANRSLRGSLILLVDDDPRVRETTADSLINWGCGVVMAGSLDEALSEASDEDIDLILVDYNLGNGCTGLDLIEQVNRQNGKSHHAIIFTGEVDPEKLKSLHGAQYPVLRKPVTPLNLRNAIHQALQEQTSDSADPD